MAKNNQLNSAAIGVGILGVVLVIIGLIMFGSLFSSMGRTINDMSSSSGPWGISSTITRSQTTPFGSSSDVLSSRSPAPPNIAVGFIGALLVGVGGFLVKVAIGMGLVANAKPIARWVGDVTGQGTARYGQTRAFRSGPTERPAQTAQTPCQNCQGLNREGARFCSQCGKEL